jgi:hypothetical protein
MGVCLGTIACALGPPDAARSQRMRPMADMLSGLSTLWLCTETPVVKEYVERRWPTRRNMPTEAGRFPIPSY